MKISFGVRKFYSLLAAGTFTMIATVVVRMVDAMVAGNMLGEDALAGVNLVTPVLSAVAFLSGLISTGMATNYSLALGRLEKRRAHEFFTQAVWSILICGGVLGLAIFFGRDAFLSFMGADAAQTAAARAYLGWYAPDAILLCLLNVFVSLGYADGDSRLCMLAYGLVFVAKVLVSAAAVALGLGLAGCAIGSVVSDAIGIGVMALHFRKASNTCCFVRHFAMKDSVKIFASSFGDAAAFLCNAILLLFVNKFAIVRFGSDLLPVLGVGTMLWGLGDVFNGTSVAVQPIVTVYNGEGNTKSAATVMRAAMGVALLEGLVVTAFMVVFPNLVVKSVGLADPVLAARGCQAVRLMSICFVALSFAGLFNSYYMFVERALLAGAVTFSCYLLLPIACIAACSLGGSDGIWAGFGLGPAAGCAVTSLFVLAVGGRQMYPLMLDRSRDSHLFVFPLALNETEIVAVSRQVADVLRQNGCTELQSMRASLMTEEVFLAVRDRNVGRSVLGEAVLDLTDGVTLTLRDDGQIFDITDADAQISSLRSFLVASVMERQTGRINLVTTGFNRNVFKF